MVNVFTVDIEDWQHSRINFSENNHWSCQNTRILDNLDAILEILADRNIKATFFVLGCIAERLPEILIKIDKKGHEIGSHGYQHKLLYTLTPDEFEQDLIKSLKIIEGILHKKVLSFRAPYWSVTEESLWAIDILQKNGLLYDSSIYPTKNFLYGIPDEPVIPHLVKKDLLEFPGSTIRVLGRNIPVGGGFFLRVFPYFWTKWAIRSLNQRGYPCMVYLHPHEVDEYNYACPGSVKENFILKFGKGRMKKKILQLLSDFKFSSLSEVAHTISLK
ncbi:MAG: polysaccharide deacetylase family protein [Candidatus Omnitrophota bacterium]